MSCTYPSFYFRAAFGNLISKDLFFPSASAACATLPPFSPCPFLHPAKGRESRKFMNSHKVTALKEVLICNVKIGLMDISSQVILWGRFRAGWSCSHIDLSGIAGSQVLFFTQEGKALLLPALGLQGCPWERLWGSISEINGVGPALSGRMAQSKELAFTKQ